MVADRARDEDRVARTRFASVDHVVDNLLADAARRDVESVAVALFNDFGVARHDGDARLAGGFGHRAHDFVERGEREPLFENEGGGEIQRLRAADGDVVHGPRDGESSDVASGKEKGLDDVAVRREDGIPFERGEKRSVVALFEPVVSEVLREDFADKLFGRKSARAVGHVDGAALKIERTGVRGGNTHLLFSFRRGA